MKTLPLSLVGVALGAIAMYMAPLGAQSAVRMVASYNALPKALLADSTGRLRVVNEGAGGGVTPNSCAASNFANAIAADGTLTCAVPAGGGNALTSNPLSQFAATTSLQFAGVISDETGTGAVVLATSPTFVTPALGTIASGNLAAGTGYTVANLAGAGAGVLTFLATPSSANLATALTNETGTGAAVFGTSPSVTWAYATKTTNYTVLSTDTALECITNACQFDLVDATTVTGKILYFKNLQTANSLTLDPSGAQTIDGASTVVITNDTLVVQSDGSNWRSLAALGVSVTPTAGGVVWTQAAALAVTAAGTTGQTLISGGTGAPTWYVPTAGSLLFAGAAGILAQDNTNLFWDDTNNYVGLGTTTPSAILHASKGTSGYTAFTDLASQSITPGVLGSFTIAQGSFAGASTAFRAVESQISVTSTVDAVRTVHAVFGDTIIPASNSTSLGNYSSYGGQFRAASLGTSNAGTLYGVNTNAQLVGIGASGQNVTGLLAQVTKGANASGTLGALYGIQTTVTNNSTSGLVTTACGLCFESFTNAGSITNTYGVLVGDITGGTQTNGAYSFISTDTSANNLFSGQTEFYVSDISSHAYGIIHAFPRVGSDEDNITVLELQSQRDASDNWVSSILELAANDGTTRREAFEVLMEGQLTGAGTWTQGPWIGIWDHINDITPFFYDASTQLLRIQETTAATGGFSSRQNYRLGNSDKIMISATAPTISSGFGTSPSIASNNGTATFRITVGSGGTATNGVIGLPTASAGWNCMATDFTTPNTGHAIKQTATTTTSATLTNYNNAGTATAWAASDVLIVQCVAY